MKKCPSCDNEMDEVYGCGNCLADQVFSENLDE